MTAITYTAETRAVVAWLEDENGGYYATRRFGSCIVQPLLAVKYDADLCDCDDIDCPETNHGMHVTAADHNDTARWWL
ncbi:hypothetical protein [Actinomadura hibisca]|uniref:hypothetical protein n=1 Tax=Actinomadura hibisca TaxID=68565 RepID=UPI000A6C6CD0|nr:hypothetical protein [Actinomadura hibisca]